MSTYTPPCPNCHSSNCDLKVEHHKPHPPHYHPPHHFNPSLLGLLATGLVVGGIAALVANSVSTKPQKFHYSKYRCLDCKHEFMAWNAEKATIAWEITNHTSHDLHLEFGSDQIRMPMKEKNYNVE